MASLVPRKGTGVLIRPAPTNSELASRVGTHREAVSRELTRMLRTGMIERRNGTLLIKDIGMLAALVQDARGE
jgi:predicted transcriptional regulator